MINELGKEIHKNAIDKGFYEDGKATNMGERLALIHAEVSEALEADRRNSYFTKEMPTYSVDNETFKMLYYDRIKGTFEEEMADIVMRVMETCAFKEIDLEYHIKAKMRFNSMREKRHGKKY